MGNDIMAPKQSPVQCTCAVNQCLTIRSLDYFSDQFIDGRILDSHEVSAAVSFCSIRVPVIVLLITGREGLTDNHHHHVKLKGPDPVDVLCGVHHPDTGLDTQPLEVFGKRKHDPFEGWRNQKNFKLQGLS